MGCGWNLTCAPACVAAEKASAQEGWGVEGRLGSVWLAKESALFHPREGQEGTA